MAVSIFTLFQRFGSKGWLKCIMTVSGLTHSITCILNDISLMGDGFRGDGWGMFLRFFVPGVPPCWLLDCHRNGSMQAQLESDFSKLYPPFEKLGWWMYLW